MKLLQYILSDFWVWLRFALLLLIVAICLLELAGTCKRGRKITVYKLDNQVSVTIEGASRADVKAVAEKAADWDRNRKVTDTVEGEDCV